MKTTTFIQYLLIGSLAITQRPSAQAQQSSRINGNGQITTKLQSVSQFSTLNIKGSWAVVEVQCGKMPLLEITTDDNIQSAIKTSVQGNVLTIRSEGWIEPTKILIRVQTPSLTRLETEGWATVNVGGLNSPYFNVLSDVGRIRLAGQADALTLDIKSTQVDASQLTTKSLTVNMNGRGKVIYAGDPARTVNAEEGEVLSLAESRKKTNSVADVTLKLHNNRLKTARLLVIGPTEKPFSYGFDLGPFGKKSEQWPIGTRVFLREEGKRGALLLQVKSENVGKVVSLF